MGRLGVYGEKTLEIIYEDMQTYTKPIQKLYNDFKLRSGDLYT